MQFFILDTGWQRRHVYLSVFHKPDEKPDQSEVMLFKPRVAEEKLIKDTKCNNTWFTSTGSEVKENVVETKEEAKR